MIFRKKDPYARKEFSRRSPSQQLQKSDGSASHDTLLDTVKSISEYDIHDTLGVLSHAATGLGKLLFKRTRELDELCMTKNLSCYVPKDTDVSVELPAPMAPLTGEYEQLEAFAEGGQAKVSVVQDRFSSRIAAAKTLRKEFWDRIAVRNNFIAEAKVTAQLEHPAIIPLYTLNGDPDGALHMVMKLVNGKTLRDYLQNLILNYRTRGVGRFDYKKVLAERLEIFIRVCDAVAYAHNKGILHRDLKPENIMLGEFMEVYLMDWGIAVKFEPQPPEGSEERNPEPLSGTPRYLSPEAIARKKCDQRSDIFAMGLILQEVVTLRFAVPGQSSADFVNNIRYGYFEPIQHLFGIRIHPTLKAIIRKATAMEQSKRYRKMEELADDLRRFRRNLETSARPDGVLMKMARLVQRQWRITMLLLAGFFAIAGAAVILSVYSRINYTEKQHQQLLGINDFHKNTIVAGTLLDNTLNHLRNQLIMVEDAAALMLTEGDADGQMAELFCFSEQVQPEAIPGKKYSPQRCNMVSYDRALGQVAAQCDPAATADFMKRTTKLYPILRNALLQSKPGHYLKGDNLDELLGEARTEMFPIKNIYIASECGVMLSYPWTDNIMDGFDARKRTWYRGAMESDGPIWSTPYLDMDGSGVSLTCSVKITAPNGKVFGVAGLDVPLSEQMTSLVKTNPHSIGIQEKSLLSKEGKVIFSSRQQAGVRELERDGEGNNQLKLQPFMSEEVRSLILRGKAEAGYFMIDQGKERDLLCSFFKLKSIDAIYVEIIPLQRVLQSVVL